MAIEWRLLFCFLCLSVGMPALMASQAQAAPPEAWSNLSQLMPGREVTVHLQAPKSKVKGAFVSYDEDGMVVRLKSGRSVKLDRKSVRKLNASRGRARTPVLVGAAAGAAVMATLTLRNSDFIPLGQVFFAAGGAGVGALFGYLVHVARGSDLVYQAPKV